MIGELVELNRQGWDVFCEEPHFLIPLSDTETLVILHHGELCEIRLETSSSRRFTPLYAKSLAELRAILDHSLGQQRPTRARMVAGLPMSNIARVAGLIGGARIESVHDPFLDDKGLDTLRVLFHLHPGAPTVPNLRLITDLTCAGTRLTANFAKAFLLEFDCPAGELRRCAAAKPHRRFMLLSGGQSLILGASLNDLNKDEAAHWKTTRQTVLFSSRNGTQARFLFTSDPIWQGPSFRSDRPLTH
jgi:hypothetical protein